MIRFFFQEADINKLIWLRIYENPLGPSSTTIELSPTTREFSMPPTSFPTS